MSWLNSICIDHFDEQDNFISIIEKDLLPNKVDFLEKDYRIDEQKFPRNPEKASSSSSKEKQKVDEFIIK